ncbi:hypothetical protein BJ165DRAFT_1613617 [Panaeolus papilionaceus]|nr:hypothetical protein BJ165DRAFT_1613617 [Panaeolus papilionaceus]
MPRWSPQELEDFERGVEKHGIGKWKQILNDESFHFHPLRKAKSLSDKYQYNLQQRGGQQLQHKKLLKPPPVTTDTPNAMSTVSPASKEALALTWMAPWSGQNKIKRTRGLYPHSLTASTSSGGNHTDAIPFMGHQSHVPDRRASHDTLAGQESTELEESTSWTESYSGRTHRCESTSSSVLDYEPFKLARPQADLVGVVETTADSEGRPDSDTVKIPSNLHSVFLPNYTHWTQPQKSTIPWYSANAPEANPSLNHVEDALYGDLIEPAFRVDQNRTFYEHVPDSRED